MKRFDNFGDYMFDLLFAPLKKGQRAVNQFRIFFRVVGRDLDDVKKAFFRARDEANVASASPVMLPVHGQDRDMPRLEGEGIEAYRTRLSMKGLISEWGGTRQGILYALTALGYDQSYIEPVSYTHLDVYKRQVSSVPACPVTTATSRARLRVVSRRRVRCSCWTP